MYVLRRGDQLATGLHVTLRNALRSKLQNWEQQIPPLWRALVAGTPLNWKSRALDHEMLPGEVILPEHPFRAFEKANPHQVRAILLGQDPYPNPDWATGRAFEQGDLTEWPDNPQGVADSLRRLVLVMMSARTGNTSYVSSDRAWTVMIADARAGRLDLERPRELFNGLEREGVLLLNASLTICVNTRAGQSKQCQREFDFWAPLIDRVLSFLAGRESGHAVFLLFGRRAEAIFDRSGAKTAAESAGAWKTRVDTVRHFHPAAITAAGAAFLRPPNPFCRANELLRKMGADPIRW